jgi:cell division protein FtsW
MRLVIHLLIGFVSVLVFLGLVALASISGSSKADLFSADSYFFRQLIWAAAGAVVLATASRVDYHEWRSWAVPLLVLVTLLLILCFVPPIGLNIKGSRRWLNLGPLRFQPSELAKPAVVLFLAWWIKRNERKVVTLRDGVLIPMTALGVVLLLIFVEPDFGTTALLTALALSLLLLGGTRLSYVVALAVLLGCGFAVAVSLDPERLRRILAFRDPERYAADEAYQLLQALRAFRMGGLWGVGLGRSIQKMYYLPEAHTDFILPIIGEELGLAASLGILAMYIGIFALGLFIAWRAPDLFGSLLAYGCTMTVAGQAAMNIAVVTGSIPTKGIGLPFVSYGGSSLIVLGLMMGMLINVARHAGGMVVDTHTQPIKDRLQRV